MADTVLLFRYSLIALFSQVFPPLRSASESTEMICSSLLCMNLLIAFHFMRTRSIVNSYNEHHIVVCLNKATFCVIIIADYIFGEYVMSVIDI